MPKELTPTFTVISKACDGDETAISKILEFYDPYINQCCMRPFYDDNNNLRLAVDLERSWRTVPVACYLTNVSVCFIQLSKTRRA